MPRVSDAELDEMSKELQGSVRMDNTVLDLIAARKRIAELEVEYIIYEARLIDADKRIAELEAREAKWQERVGKLFGMSFVRYREFPQEDLWCMPFPRPTWSGRPEGCPVGALEAMLEDIGDK